MLTDVTSVSAVVVAAGAGLMNAFLFAAARRGDVATVEQLLSHNSIKAQANCIDETLRSPLHVAVQRYDFHSLQFARPCVMLGPVGV